MSTSPLVLYPTVCLDHSSILSPSIAPDSMSLETQLATKVPALAGGMAGK